MDDCQKSDVNTDIMTCGEYIRLNRKRITVSLRCMAQKIEVAPSYLSDIELDRRVLNMKMARLLSMNLGLTQQGRKVFYDQVLVKSGLMTTERAHLIEILEDYERIHSVLYDCILKGR